MPAVAFVPIDLSRYAAQCVAFRRDSYVCSFGDDARFFEKGGPDAQGYLAWLRDRTQAFPEGHVHVWQGAEIVGQLELSVTERPPGSGYINLFYLVPAVRGSGLGDRLHAYAMRVFAQRGVEVLRLSVSPSNARAVRYYTKHGWTSLGPRPGLEHVHLWEKHLRVAGCDEEGA